MHKHLKWMVPTVERISLESCQAWIEPTLPGYVEGTPLPPDQERARQATREALRQTPGAPIEDIIKQFPSRLRIYGLLQTWIGNALGRPQGYARNGTALGLPSPRAGTRPAATNHGTVTVGAALVAALWLGDL